MTIITPSGTTPSEIPLSEAAIASPPAEAVGRHAILYRLVRSPVAIICGLFILFLVVLAVFAPQIAPYNPNKVDLTAVYQPPSSEHLLGTDQLGRDQLSRLIFGTRTSLVAGVEAVGISLLLGVPFGLIAGYVGGKVDGAFSRVNDALMSVPNLILALAVVAVLGTGLFNAMLAVGIVFTPRVFRVVRAAALDIRHNTFVEALESIGCSRGRILVLHILPNSLSPLLVVISVSLGGAVLAEASLTFLGLGVSPPTSSWGGMLAQASQRLDLRYLMFPPGVAIFLTVAAFTFLGDNLRDILGARKEGRGA